MNTTKGTRWPRSTSVLAGLVICATVLTGCDVGSSIAADNTTANAVLARLHGTSVAGGFHVFEYEVIVPAKTRLVLAEQPFTGDRVNEVEILSSTDCEVIADFTSVELGELFVINEGPSVEQRHEFPTGSPTAQRTDACPTPTHVPGASAAPSPSG